METKADMETKPINNQEQTEDTVKLGKRTRDQTTLDETQNGSDHLNQNESESIYFFKHGLRFVNPYQHQFTCFAKRRWIDQLLIDIYSIEFKAFSLDYYTNAIEYWKNKENKGTTIKGKITVNGKDISLQYRIKDGDKIVHSTVREETPVYDELPRVIQQTNDYLVVDKPSSIPVHACGNF